MNNPFLSWEERERLEAEHEAKLKEESKQLTKENEKKVDEVKAEGSVVRDFAYGGNTKAHGGDMTDEKVEAATEGIAGM
jgi:hypothetical protein